MNTDSEVYLLLNHEQQKAIGYPYPCEYVVIALEYDGIDEYFTMQHFKDQHHASTRYPDALYIPKQNTTTMAVAYKLGASLAQCVEAFAIALN